jgi:hypothetical protein
MTPGTPVGARFDARPALDGFDNVDGLDGLPPPGVPIVDGPVLLGAPGATPVPTPLGVATGVPVDVPVDVPVCAPTLTAVRHSATITPRAVPRLS